MINLSDPKLKEMLLKSQNGDAGIYGKFLKLVYQNLKLIVRKKIFDSTESEDVIQEILIAVHISLPTYLPYKPLAPWILGLTQHKVIDAIRRLSRKSKRESYLSEDPAFDITYSEFAIDDSYATALEYLNTLPDKQRLVVKLMKLENLSILETASLLGMSSSAVKVCAHRAYKKLRDLREKINENK